MVRALSIGGLLVAGLIGALLATAVKFPVPDSISDWLTPLVAIATVAQAFFAFWALRGLSHSRRSADAASATIDIMKLTAEQQLRAYVSISQFKVSRLSDHRIVVTAKIRNVGQTPALGVRCRDLVVIREADDDSPLPDLADEGSQHDWSLNMTPNHGGTLKSAIDAELTSDIEWRLHHYGLIEYRDVFDVERKTKFHAWSMAPFGKTLPDALQAYRHGNETT